MRTSWGARNEHDSCLLPGSGELWKPAMLPRGDTAEHRSNRSQPDMTLARRR